MKMRFLLTMACLSALAVNAETLWTDPFQAVDSVEAKGNVVAATTASGEVLVAGVFNQEFSFGSYDLEPIARSTYLIKYDPEGGKQWGVSFAGAATPTAMTTDDAGNVYVAGIYADQVVFGSTDGATQSVTGIEDAILEEIVTEQGAGFIAKYSPSGVLLKVQAYKPEPFEEIITAVQSDPEGGIFYIQDLRFFATDLQFIQDKLLVSARYSGVVKNNGLTLEASYDNSWGFLFVEIFAGAILELNVGDLSISKVYANLRPALSQGQIDVETILFTAAGDKLYGAFNTIGGTHTLSVNGQDQTISFPPSGEEYASGHAFVQLNLTTGELGAVNSSFYQALRDADYELSSLYQSNGQLILSGTHKTALVFKPELTSEVRDLFVAALDANDMQTVNFAVHSGATVQRDFASATLHEDQLLVACNEAATSGIFSVDLPDGTTTGYAPQEDNVLTNVVYSKDKIKVTVQNILGETSAELATTKVSVEGSNTNIQQPASGKGGIISFDSPKNVLHFTEPATVVVYNSVGERMLQTANARSLSVSSLPKGAYIALAQTNGKTETLKFINN